VEERSRSVESTRHACIFKQLRSSEAGRAA
jgi:hypothetical protein